MAAYVEEHRRDQYHGILPHFTLLKSFLNLLFEVGTHADSLIAEAVLKNITGFDRDLAWEAVWKDATVPPVDDWTVMYDLTSLFRHSLADASTSDTLTEKRSITTFFFFQ